MRLETGKGAEGAMSESQHSRDSSQETRYALLRRNLLEALAKNPNYAFTTELLFDETQADDRKLGNAILSRLVREGKVDRLSRGVYRHKRIGTLAKTDPPTSYHGIHLVLPSGAPSPLLLAALTAQDNGKTAVGEKYASVPHIRLPLGVAREAAILVSSSIEVRIACTDNPMSAEVLYGVLWGLDGAYDLGFTKFPWQAGRIEANKDHVGFAIDGASTVTVNLGEFMLKAYNRPGILREEVIVHRVPLNEVLEHLNGQGAVGNVQIRDALEESGKAFARMSRSLDANTLELHHWRKERQQQDNAKTAVK
jgi:hypothetical protein